VVAWVGIEQIKENREPLFANRCHDMSQSVLQSVYSVRPYLEGLFLPQGQFAVIIAAETWSPPWHSSGRCTLQDVFGPALSPSGAQVKLEIKLLLYFALCLICYRYNSLLTNQRILRCNSEVCKAPALPLIPNIAEAHITMAGVLKLSRSQLCK
jgi:hypothetical protein